LIKHLIAMPPTLKTEASTGSLPADSPDSDESQLALMRVLNEQPALSQRELSRALGLSLGKTHYVLHALLDRGLVKAGNFKRNDNKLAYVYLLTPEGLHEKLTMTRRFLVRKEAEFEHLKKAITDLRNEVEDIASPSTPRG
jgi:EPS-associated MarR family transcriptional regulator